MFFKHCGISYRKYFIRAFVLARQEQYFPTFKIVHSFLPLNIKLGSNVSFIITSIYYKEFFFQNADKIGKKVEVFSFFLVKHHLNDISDRTVRCCFTGKNGEFGHKKILRLIPKDFHIYSLSFAKPVLSMINIISPITIPTIVARHIPVS